MNGYRSEGCCNCGQDNDHRYLLLCEYCNDEYHTYCLEPPLTSVPDHDFYCPNCQDKGIGQNHALSSAPTSSSANCDQFQNTPNDNLDEQVAALPPLFTQRFGGIIWAAGGVGFGWWSACIYDPRLTIGVARKLALKNIGKKHLVCFFGCADAPFTVLLDDKCLAWEMGLLEKYSFDGGRLRGVW